MVGQFGIAREDVADDGDTVKPRDGGQGDVLEDPNEVDDDGQQLVG